MLGLGTILNYASSALAVLLLRYDKFEKLPLDLEKQNLTNCQNTDSDYSLNLHCSKCLNPNKLYQNSSKSIVICTNNNCPRCPLYNQQSVHEPSLQLIVALPTSFYYRQYHKQTFDKIKKSYSDCHLQSKICFFSASGNQIRSTMQAPTTSNNCKEFNPLNENIIYQRDVQSVKLINELNDNELIYKKHIEDSNSFKDNSPQLTSCYIDKGFVSSLEFDLNLNYFEKLPTIQTEMKVKSKFKLTKLKINFLISY